VPLPAMRMLKVRSTQQHTLGPRTMSCRMLLLCSPPPPLLLLLQTLLKYLLSQSVKGISTSSGARAHRQPCWGVSLCQWSMSCQLGCCTVNGTGTGECRMLARGSTTVR
jgi:hypothetical protein